MLAGRDARIPGQKGAVRQRPPPATLHHALAQPLGCLIGEGGENPAWYRPKADRKPGRMVTIFNLPGAGNVWNIRPQVRNDCSPSHANPPRLTEVRQRPLTEGAKRPVRPSWRFVIGTCHHRTRFIQAMKCFFLFKLRDDVQFLQIHGGCGVSSGSACRMLVNQITSARASHSINRKTPSTNPTK